MVLVSELFSYTSFYRYLRAERHKLRKRVFWFGTQDSLLPDCDKILIQC